MVNGAKIRCSILPLFARMTTGGNMADGQISDPRIEQTIGWFSTIYLGGIPPIITNDSALLSFVCVLAATEALAGYRFSDERNPGERFNQFVRTYFPPEYHPFTHSCMGSHRRAFCSLTITAKFICGKIRTLEIPS
jgi:hypothetical protein